MKSLYNYILEAVEWTSTSTEDEGIDDIDLFSNAYIPIAKKPAKKDIQYKFVDFNFDEKEDKNVSIYILDSGRMHWEKKYVEKLLKELNKKYTGTINLYRAGSDCKPPEKIDSIKDLHTQGPHPFFDEVLNYVVKNSENVDYNIFITDEDVFWLKSEDNGVELVKTALEKTNLIFYTLEGNEPWIGIELDKEGLLEKGKCEVYRLGTRSNSDWYWFKK